MWLTPLSPIRPRGPERPGRGPRRAASRRRASRPRLEALEGRALLSVVTSPLDDGSAGTLRYQIANDLAGDTITFAPDVHQITLTGGELYINKVLNIAGPGASGLTIQGDGAHRVFEVAAGTGTSSNPVTISGLAISGGRADSGGGIYNAGTLTVSSCTIAGNAGGGIVNGGTLTVTSCTIARNFNDGGNGGGIVNGGTLTVTSSTFVGNSAYSAGGGIYSNNYGAPLTVTNSTFVGNSAPLSYGGGIFAINPLAVISSTFSGNSAYGGGGITASTVTLTCQNTIIAGNTATSVGPDVCLDRPVNSPGHNLVGVTDGSSGWTSTDLTGTSAAPLNPLLGPLQDNGGPTQTMALLPGSPAIDAGDNALAVDAQGNPLTTDQRGPGFPRIVNGTVDIGAFESSGLTNVSSDIINGDFSLGNTGFMSRYTFTGNSSTSPKSSEVLALHSTSANHRPGTDGDPGDQFSP